MKVRTNDEIRSVFRALNAEDTASRRLAEVRRPNSAALHDGDEFLKDFEEQMEDQLDVILKTYDAFASK